MGSKDGQENKAYKGKNKKKKKERKKKKKTIVTMGSDRWIDVTNLIVVIILQYIHV